MTEALDLLTKRYVTIELDNTVSKLLGKLRRAGETTALVLDKGKLKGAVDKRLLLSTKLDPAMMKVKNAVKRRSKSKTPFYVPELKPDTSIEKICKLMTSSGMRMLPVVENGKLKGVVKIMDVAREIASAYPIPCEKLATSRVVSVKEKTKISSAITKMIRNDCDHIPVVDEENKCIGLISLSDVLAQPNFWHVHGVHLNKKLNHRGGGRKGGFTGEKPSTTESQVRTFMNEKQPLMTAPRVNASKAIMNMVDEKVHSIILARYREPVGMLTISDVVKDYAKR